MKPILFCACIVLGIISMFRSCIDDDDEGTTVVNFGKNRFTTILEEDTREYYVHVPKSYNAIDALPVVFMLHGSGGSGERFYNISGWKDVGEAQNILTVFPSAAQYPCVLDDGIQKRRAEKWNCYGLELCNGETPQDDVKFLTQIIDELKHRYMIDEKRIYIAGFSNGGEMAARTAIELSDKIAAVVACAGALPTDTTFVPTRKLPILLQAGNSDAKLMAQLETTTPLPMDFDELFTQFAAVEKIANTITRSFALDSVYTVGGTSNTFIYADYKNDFGSSDNVFRFMLVKGLGHSYPNGKNHPLMGAEVHWNWMKDYRLP
ncbi:MAG TPA: PHB depolymerase family esterase [Chryseolinea sp.]